MGNESDSLVLKQAARLGELLAQVGALQRAIDELHGKTLQAASGCGLQQVHLGDADVWVEYEYEPASGDGWDEPREEATVTVIGVFLNGVMCSADVAPQMIEEWEVEIMESLNDEAASQFREPDDSRDDEAADRASDRWEQARDARAAA